MRTLRTSAAPRFGRAPVTRRATLARRFPRTCNRIAPPPVYWACGRGRARRGSSTCLVPPRTSTPSTGRRRGRCSRSCTASPVTGRRPRTACRRRTPAPGSAGPPCSRWRSRGLGARGGDAAGAQPVAAGPAGPRAAPARAAAGRRAGPDRGRRRPGPGAPAAPRAGRRRGRSAAGPRRARRPARARPAAQDRGRPERARERGRPAPARRRSGRSARRRPRRAPPRWAVRRQGARRHARVRAAGGGPLTGPRSVSPPRRRRSAARPRSRTARRAPGSRRWSAGPTRRSPASCTIVAASRAGSAAPSGTPDQQVQRQLLDLEVGVLVVVVRLEPEHRAGRLVERRDRGLELLLGRLEPRVVERLGAVVRRRADRLDRGTQASIRSLSVAAAARSSADPVAVRSRVPGAVVRSQRHRRSLGGSHRSGGCSRASWPAGSAAWSAAAAAPWRPRGGSGTAR